MAPHRMKVVPLIGKERSYFKAALGFRYDGDLLWMLEASCHPISRRIEELLAQNEKKRKQKKRQPNSANYIRDFQLELRWLRRKIHREKAAAKAARKKTTKRKAA